MKDKKSFLIIAIVVIVLLSFAHQLIKNIDHSKEDDKKKQTNEYVLPLSSREADTLSEDYEQAYDSFLSFPYDNLNFVDGKTFEIIQKAYNNIYFYSEFKQGDLEVYDFYKKKYNLFLNSDNALLEQIKGNDSDNYDLNSYIYYFFDMNEDGTPELCISDAVNFIYIFKYDSVLDKISLWYELDSTWYHLNGSKTIRWNNGGIKHAFYKLDTDGDEVYSVSFFSREDYNRRLSQAEVVYMLALPQYADKDEEIRLTDKIRNQGYFDIGQELYYFRVTE